MHVCHERMLYMKVKKMNRFLEISLPEGEDCDAIIAGKSTKISTLEEIVDNIILEIRISVGKVKCRYSRSVTGN